MKKDYIIIIVIFVVIVLIIIGIIIYLVYKFSPSGDPALIHLTRIQYPFKEGDSIRLSFVKTNQSVPDLYKYSYYNVTPELNDNNTSGGGAGPQIECIAAYNALNATLVWDSNSNLRVNFDTVDPTRFSMRTANGSYCYLSAPLNSTTVVPNAQFISFGRPNTTTQDVWFRLAFIDIESGNYVLRTAGLNTPALSMGLLKTLSLTGTKSFGACFRGQGVTEVATGGTPIGYILGNAGESNIQQFFVTNLTTPIPASSPVPPFNFDDTDIIGVKFSSGNDYYLFNGCADVGTTISFAKVDNTDRRSQWTVHLSTDRNAFALSQGGNYLTVFVESRIDPLPVITFVTLAMGGSSLSSYDAGNYTNWFTINSDGFMISLLLNMSIFVDISSTVSCSSLSALPARGAALNSGSKITTVQVSG